MARVDKYHKGALGHLLRHFERAKDDNGEYIKFKNQNIRLDETGNNYNLAEFQTLPQLEFIHKRLSEVKVFNRPDVKVMCSWVVTLPKRMEPDEEQFFQESFKFLSHRYGKENVISAYVHKDETQPHMHFAFVPVTTDKKKNIQKVSAKEVLTRVDLQKFHGDLDEHLTRVFGRSTGILNDATKDGNKSIDDLKRGTAVKILKEKQADIQALEKQFEALQWGDKITPIKEKKDIVVISKADFDSANAVKAKRVMYEEQAKAAETDKTKSLKSTRMDNFKLFDENRKLKTEHTALIHEMNKLKNELSGMYKVFDRNPKFWEEFLRLAEQMERLKEAEFIAQKKALQRIRTLEAEM